MLVRTNLPVIRLLSGFRPVTVPARYEGSQLCEACHTLILEAQVVLTDPDNINAVVSLAEGQLCAKLVDPQLVSKVNQILLIKVFSFWLLQCFRGASFSTPPLNLLSSRVAFVETLLLLLQMRVVVLLNWPTSLLGLIDHFEFRYGT
jgi:hypothetical protein